jgi:hypothetical protein
MRKLAVILICLLYLGCKDSSPVVGSAEVNPITTASFTVTGFQATGTELSATGRVRNNGSARISPPWYIEGIFYSDSTLTLQLGGRNMTMNVSLDPGVETLWTLQFSDDSIIESDYPNFRVSNLRAYYRQ